MSNDLVKNPAEHRAQASISSVTARVTLGRTGSSVSTAAQLQFQLDHAAARDAVHTELDVARLVSDLHQRGLHPITLRSAVSSQTNRSARGVYLRRPDLGRRLHPDAARELTTLSQDGSARGEIAFVLGDGLSALALERHAIALLDVATPLLASEGWRLTPVCVATQARVALGDEIGSILKASAVVMLIGERPGLSSPDSLGVYITWAPRVGRTDAERNCISNIRREGLSYTDAAERIVFYLRHARDLQGTGVALKWSAGPLTPLLQGDA